MNSIVLWLSQGFGTGRLPVAPGTAGSLVGVLWFAVLLLPHSLWWYAAGTLAGIAASVWLCGAGERILQRKGPGSIVLDEITAVPVGYASLVAIATAEAGEVPAPSYFFSWPVWWWTLAAFVAFRVFDIWKPWPVRQSQKLPGGWGVTVDDVLAAVYVNAVVLVALGIMNR